MQHLGRGLLAHLLTQTQYQVLPPIGNPGVGGCPRDAFLLSTMRGTSNLARRVTFEDNPAKRLYERLGFKVFEKKDFTIKMEKRPNKALHRTPTSGAG